MQIRIAGDDYIGVSHFGALVEVGLDTDAAGQADLVLRFLTNVLQVRSDGVLK